MTRFLLLSAFCLPTLGLLACTPKPDDDDPPVDSDTAADSDSDSGAETDTPTDTTPQFSPWQPATVTLSIDFAWDPRALQARPYTVDGVETAPNLTLRFASDAATADPATEDQRCQAKWSVAQRGVDPDAPSGSTVALSLDWSTGVVVDTDCADRIDPAWVADIVAALDGVTWKHDLFVALLPPYEADLLAAGTYTEADLERYTSSALRGSLAAAVGRPAYYEALTAAYAIDTAGVVQLDGGAPVVIAQAEMFSNGRPGPAWYSTQVFIDTATIGLMLGAAGETPNDTPTDTASGGGGAPGPGTGPGAGTTP